VREAHAELVLAELLELAPNGVEEVAPQPGVVEYAVYGAPGELPELPDLQAVAGEALVELRTEQIPDDWAGRWREFHRPLVLGDDLSVRPPWAAPERTAVEVVIDPGQAFGTGAHATTRLCLELMLGVAAGGALVDLGCGSGVLAIAGAKLGFSPVVALDYDPVAVATTEKNARVNGVDIDARRFDLRDGQVPDAELVVANVLAGPLRTWAEIQERLPPRLILSGLLQTEADAVSGAYTARGLREHDRRSEGDWAALQLTRPSA
jgi:ribosomal protein L11 methyltransferase